MASDALILRFFKSMLQIPAKYLLIFVLTLAPLASSCGDESTPDVNELTLREALGLDAERVSALQRSDRDAIRRQIVAAWDDAVQAPPDVDTIAVEAELIDDDTGLVPPMEFVARYDADRSRAGEGVVVSGRVDANPDASDAEIRGTPIPLEVLGFALEDGGRVKPIQDDEAVFEGQIRWDDEWRRVESDSLLGANELEVVQDLEPMFRRYLYQMGLTTEIAQVVRSESSPVVMWYAREHRAVLVNPNLLYVLSDGALEANAANGQSISGPIVASDAAFLSPEFIEQCVDEQQARCSRCFGSGTPVSATLCQPLLGDGAPGIAEAECDWMTQDRNRGFYLFCYNRAVANNYACIATQDPADTCMARNGPYDRLDDLEKLSPMLEEGSFCESVVRDCQESRVTDAEIPEPPPAKDEDHHDDGSGDWCGDALAVTCDIGTSCGDGCGSGGSGGGGGCGGDTGGGGGCGGDTGGGLCDEDAGDDDSAEASIVKPGALGGKGLILGLPFLMLIVLRGSNSSRCGREGY